MTQVVHVVLVDWRAEDPEAAAELARTADELADRHLAPLPGVVSIDRGTPLAGEGLEGGFDWALVVRFASEQALAAYLPHPEHRIAARHLEAGAQRIVVFDLASPGVADPR